MFITGNSFLRQPLLPISINILGILIIFYFIMVAFHVRPCSDDLFFWVLFNEKGWWGSAVGLNWNKRWTSYLVANSVYGIAGNFNTLSITIFGYYIGSFLLIALGFIRLLRLSIYHLTDNRVPCHKLASLAVLLIYGLYLSSLQPYDQFLPCTCARYQSVCISNI